jgi:hypothetical protein
VNQACAQVKTHTAEGDHKEIEVSGLGANHKGKKHGLSEREGQRDWFAGSNQSLASVRAGQNPNKDADASGPAAHRRADCGNIAGITGRQQS